MQRDDYVEVTNVIFRFKTALSAAASIRAQAGRTLAVDIWQDSHVEVNRIFFVGIIGVPCGTGVNEFKSDFVYRIRG